MKWVKENFIPILFVVGSMVSYAHATFPSFKYFDQAVRSMADDIREIRRDVRELRNFYIGEKGNGNPSTNR